MKNINKPKKGIKKTNNKDKNGFTLVELLAVIVVLATLVLIAGRAVTGQITKAKKDTFRTESIEFAKGMIDYFDLNSTSGENDMTSVPGYEYNCLTLATLKSEEYIEFSTNKKYVGFVQVWKAGADKTVKITLTDGKAYSYEGITLSELEADKANTKITLDVFAAEDVDQCPIPAVPAS